MGDILSPRPALTQAHHAGQRRGQHGRKPQEPSKPKITLLLGRPKSPDHVAVVEVACEFPSDTGRHHSVGSAVFGWPKEAAAPSTCH